MTKKKDPSTFARLGKLPEFECGLADAVRIARSKTALARMLKLGTIDKRTGQVKNDRQVVSEWFRRGAVPRQYVMPIHEATGVPLEKLLTPFPPYRPSTKELAEELAAEIAEEAAPTVPEVPDVMDALKKKPRPSKKKAA